MPSSGFTQRATLDPELNEIHVLTVSNASTAPLPWLLFQFNGFFHFSVFKYFTVVGQCMVTLAMQVQLL